MYWGRGWDGGMGTGQGGRIQRVSNVRTVAAFGFPFIKCPPSNNRISSFILL